MKSDAEFMAYLCINVNLFIRKLLGSVVFGEGGAVSQDRLAPTRIISPYSIIFSNFVKRDHKKRDKTRVFFVEAPVVCAFLTAAIDVSFRESKRVVFDRKTRRTVDWARFF